MKERYVKAYEELTFADNFMFCEIMKNNPELCKTVIETILDVKIREIVRIGTEDSIKTSFDGRGVRLDVYVEGDEEIYDVEMQTHNIGNLPKRSRYYQGILDTDYLKSGEDYGRLRKTYVIFICTFDIFGYGLPKYTFMNKCNEEASLFLGDESIKVFVNAKGALEKASPKLREFLEYLVDGKVRGELSENIDEDLKDARRDEGRRAKYMTFEWELARERREGREEGRLELIEKIMKTLTPEQLTQVGITEEEIKKINALKESK